MHLKISFYLHGTVSALHTLASRFLLPNAGTSLSFRVFFDPSQPWTPGNGAEDPFLCAMPPSHSAVELWGQCLYCPPAPLTGQQQTDWPWKMAVLLLFMNGKTGELEELYANNCPCAWMHLWYSALLFMLNSMNVFLSLHLSWVPLLYWRF